MLKKESEIMREYGFSKTHEGAVRNQYMLQQGTLQLTGSTETHSNEESTEATHGKLPHQDLIMEECDSIRKMKGMEAARLPLKPEKLMLYKCLVETENMKDFQLEGSQLSDKTELQAKVN